MGVTLSRREACGGSRFGFSYEGSGEYDPEPGVWATLTRTVTATPTYYLRGVDQSLYVFDHQGTLREMRDPQGHTLTLVYSGTHLSRVEDGTGERFLAFAYVGDRLVEVRDPIDRTVRFSYSGDDLTAVTDTLGQRWTYGYTDHLLTDARDPRGQMVVGIEYDGQERAVRQWDGQQGEPYQIQYDPVTRSTIITDPLRNMTVDRYNGFGALGYQATAGMGHGIGLTTTT